MAYRRTKIEIAIDTALAEIDLPLEKGEPLKAMIKEYKKKKQIPVDKMLQIIDELEIDEHGEEIIAKCLSDIGYNIVAPEDDDNKNWENMVLETASAQKKTGRKESDTVDAYTLVCKAISDYRILEHQEVVELIGIYQDGIKTRDFLTEIDQSEYDTDLLKELKNKISEGEKARETIINSTLRMALYIAKKYTGPGRDILDLFQEASYGLTYAFEKYNVDRGFKFSTYATFWVKRNVLRYISNESQLYFPQHILEWKPILLKTEEQFFNEQGRVPTIKELSELLGITETTVKSVKKALQEEFSLNKDTLNPDDEKHSMLDFIEDKDAPNPEKIAIREALKDTMGKLLYKLEPREEKVLKLRYGLEDGNPRSLEAVGRELSLTRERIRQIEFSSLEKLKKMSDENGLDDFL